MTAAFNHRTDKYGGSLENRVRFLGECIEAVQRYCGKDFPQIIKFTPVHCMDTPGYRKLEEGVEIAKLLEKTLIDNGLWTTTNNNDSHNILRDEVLMLLA